MNGVRSAALREGGEKCSTWSSQPVLPAGCFGSPSLGSDAFERSPECDGCVAVDAPDRLHTYDAEISRRARAETDRTETAVCRLKPIGPRPPPAACRLKQRRVAPKLVVGG
jgi:hypothetical protein